jgi:hypothetical protein
MGWQIAIGYYYTPILIFVEVKSAITLEFNITRFVIKSSLDIAMLVK